jgi:hypothetical protein
MKPGETKAIYWSPIEKKEIEGYAILIKRIWDDKDTLEFWEVKFLWPHQKNKKRAIARPFKDWSHTSRLAFNFFDPAKGHVNPFVRNEQFYISLWRSICKRYDLD